MFFGASFAITQKYIISQAHDDYEGPLVNKSSDNHGPRYFLLAVTFFHVSGYMMASFPTKYYQFVLSQVVCPPTGASMLFSPGMYQSVYEYKRI